MSREEAAGSIARRILAGERSLDRIKREECRRFGIGRMIRNPEILACIPEGGITPEIRSLLLKRPMRTASGVTPIAVMVRPQGSCRHGCIYCPAGGLAAKSYSGFEPAALRSRQYGYDPFLQASSRAAQFEGAGHPADKCEIIIMGGTFLEMEPEYRRGFVKGVYEGLNGGRSATLEDAIAANERGGAHRAIGLTIETRPDACIPYIGEMLSYGATRVELGVQHPDDGIYRAISRGHTVQDVADSTRALKDAAFKVCYHIMPGLPGSGPGKDAAMVRRLFSEGRFRPDMLKIYPTLVMEGTPLKAIADAGGYEPYSAEEAADVISEFYRHIPPYVRVMRIQRDIPAGLICGGVKKSNLRELVERKLREKGISPVEIRCREAGLCGRAPAASEFRLRSIDYASAGGRERFLSFESGNAAGEGLIAGFIRLRFPAGGDAALVRELHVYGNEVPIGGRGGIQHSGLGSRLLVAAEHAAADAGRGKILVISGVGAREYYRRCGYSLEGPYMAKRL